MKLVAQNKALNGASENKSDADGINLAFDGVTMNRQAGQYQYKLLADQVLYVIPEGGRHTTITALDGEFHPNPRLEQIFYASGAGEYLITGRACVIIAPRGELKPLHREIVSHGETFPVTTVLDYKKEQTIAAILKTRARGELELISDKGGVYYILSGSIHTHEYGDVHLQNEILTVAPNKLLDITPGLRGATMLFIAY
jgi:hypothetical protein